MNTRYLAALAATASTLAIAYTQPASAQTAAQATASNGIGLEEVIVTARRKEEKAQTVPITITAYSQVQLEQQEIHAATDLNKVVPAIQICCNRGAASFVWIRGIPGVIGYFNAIPTVAGAANPTGLNGEATYFDLSNLQVLKGPQGTLFGLSTNGGALLFESKKPTNNFEGYVQAEGGNLGHVGAEGVLNIPIVDEKLLLRVGGQYQHTDGFVHDVRNNRDFYDETYGVGRISLTARPTDDIQNDLVVNYFRNHDHGTTFVWTALRGNLPAIPGQIPPSRQAPASRCSCSATHLSSMLKALPRGASSMPSISSWPWAIIRSSGRTPAVHPTQTGRSSTFRTRPLGISTTI